MKNNIPTVAHNQQLQRRIVAAANGFVSSVNLANDTREIRAAFEDLFETWQDVERGFVEEDDRPEEHEGQDALRTFMGKDD